jgi:hypothetical protein
MKPKQTPTSTMTLRGQPLMQIDKAKNYLARFGVRNVSDVDVVHLALKELLLKPDLVDAMRHIKPTEGGRKSKRLPPPKKRKLRANPFLALMGKLPQNPTTPRDSHQTGTEGSAQA